MQAGFRPKHWLEDLAILVDVALDESIKTNSPLAVGFVDLEKAFDSMPRDALLRTLAVCYNIYPSVLEQIWHIYKDTVGIVRGASSHFWITRGIK